MKSIYLLTELYYPETTSTGYFLTKIAEGLAQENEVKVITAFPFNHARLENVLQFEIVNRVEILRYKGTSFDRNILFWRLVNSFLFLIKSFYKLLLVCKREDILLVVTNPPLLPFIALLINLIKGSDIILLIHDVYPEVLVATKVSNPLSLIVKIGWLANYFLYKKSSKIITLGRDVFQLLESKVKIDKNKVCCIPNWAEDEIIPLSKKDNSLLQKLNLINHFIVLYAGNLGRTHGIEDLAEVASFLKEKNDLHFLVIGAGGKKSWLENYIKENSLTNISVCPYLPSSEKIVSLNACDVALISFVPGMAGVSVPSRMYNQMAAGKPIIAVADEWSELAQVIQEEKIGWVVKPGDTQQLMNIIILAAQNPSLCAEMGIRAALVAKTKYTFSQADQSYKNLVKQL